MKILYDHQAFSSQRQGGVSRYFFELARGLAPLAQEGEIALSYTDNRYLKDWDPARFHTLWPRLDFRGKNRVLGLFNDGASRRALKRGRWDLFHPTYFDPYFLPLLGDRPFVLTIHDMVHEKFPHGIADAAVVPRRKALLAQRARAVITVSENTRRDAIEILGLPPGKVTTVHHGNSLRPDLVRPEAPKLDRPYWLYVGTRENYKNWTLLVEALARRRDASDFLVMVGGGGLSAAELSLLERAGLGGRWLQTGASEAQLAGFYAGARALIVTSRYEGFGMPLLEAMAFSCPVITSQISSLPEVAADAALYFDPAKAEDLAARMGEVGSAKSELVRRGLEREAGFRWSRTLGETLAVYQGALG